VLDVLLAVTGGRNRGIKTENQTQHSRLAVLDFKGPATLVELGFIDNAHDRGWLTSRDARIAFWTGVKEALLRG
jgi:N-acetylmuramoyl-L-alanine amidase